MSRHVLACFTGGNRPAFIVPQDGGPMPKCESMDKGTRGHYEFIEVLQPLEVMQVYNALQPQTIIIAACAGAVVSWLGLGLYRFGKSLLGFR